MERKQKLRQGYTTGTCAAIAAKAAVKRLFYGKWEAHERILTPKGIWVDTEILDATVTGKKTSCAVKKDAGDDPDVTNGILIYAAVELTEEPGIEIDGGEGVGRVTKKGLNQQIGEAAINPVPKAMIQKEVKEVLEKNGYLGGAKVLIYVPKGREIAKKTFNPRLGIVDGISILGTTGIVEPMSDQALLQSIRVEMNVAKANGIRNLILTPGNYGEEFIRKELKLSLSSAVKCSNFIGETIDMAMEIGFDSILLIGHAGKLVKLAAGIMNTHSHMADGRMEVITVHAALSGAQKEVLERLMECIAVDDAVRILKENNMFESTMGGILKKIAFHLKQRCFHEIPISAILFSQVYGILGMTEGATELLKRQNRK